MRRTVFNDRGHAHHLNFSCFQGRPFLREESICQWLAAALDEARLKHSFDLWAYVFMPEHVHIVLHPKSHPYDMGEIRKAVKEPCAKRAVGWAERDRPDMFAAMRDEQPNGKVAHRLWQRGGGHDRNIWSVRYLADVINYIHNNPVEAGLCSRPEDWHWSSAADHLGLRAGPIRVDRESLPVLRGWGAPGNSG